MKQGTDITQTQNLQQVQTLSPQQVLAVKLLELPAMEFEERVKTELQDNPALEPSADHESEYMENDVQEAEASGEYEDNYSDNNDEDLSLGDYRTEDDIPDYKLKENNGSQTVRAEDIPFSDSVSFYENLMEQLGETDTDETTKRIAEYIIGSIDDDGLLRKNLETLKDELELYAGISASDEEMKNALSIVQSMDPAGIGARSLQECLLLQIDRNEESKLQKVKHDIIEQCYDAFVKKRRDKIMQKLHITEEVCDKALSEIVRLNPRPGISLGEAIGRNTQIIIPDFTVDTHENGTIDISLNNYNVPDLKINKTFSDIINDAARKKGKQTKSEKDAALFAKQKIESAQNFIDAIKQRQNTLFITMKTIVELQRPFFLEGDESLLKPMILKDVADRAKLDISTISRVSNSKYVQTNYGVFPLKFFFSDSYTTDSGDKLSVREMKHILKEMIDSENPDTPYTDDELTEMLNEKGYPIARRTVAKYRQQLNIPVARLRK